MKKLKNSELDRIDVSTFKSIKKTPLIIILDNIRSLNNIGSIFRTSDAFLIEKIYLCGITATPPNRKITKTAIGSTETVEWEYINDINDLIDNLINHQVKIWSVEQVVKSTKLQDLKSIDSKKKHALIFGNEIDGVSQEVINKSDGLIEINQYGTKHSLNISVAVGIVIWKFYNLIKSN
jgi:23S rRNA (guanosine2251-2'-O)-methyltransferase|tara:strand:- start:2687 stop:3223 length:537 start_codon:yes stop_codon:yes gene_type:complete